MPIYHKLGEFPQKRHVVFQSKENKHRYEQLFGTEGFSGFSSLLYHVHRPTQVKEILRSYDVTPKIAIEKNIKALLLKGFDIKPTSDFLDSRKTVLMNGDCLIGLAAPQHSMKNYLWEIFRLSMAIT
jgi:homogentisate 1,2-dioxygenase